VTATGRRAGAPDGDRATAGWRARLDTPGVVVVITVAAALVVVVLRLGGAADGNIDAFLVSGERFNDTARSGIRTYGPDGYDGQFHYRLALNPAQLEGEVNASSSTGGCGPGASATRPWPGWARWASPGWCPGRWSG
jgi:hypothetical protein